MAPEGVHPPGHHGPSGRLGKLKLGGTKKAPPRNAQRQGNHSQGAEEKQLVLFFLRQFPGFFMVLQVKESAHVHEKWPANEDGDHPLAGPPESAKD